MTREPFKKSLHRIPVEEAHGGAGSRQMILSQDDPVSKHLEAMTKGYLKAGAAFDWHHHDAIDEFFFVIRGAGSISFKDGDTWNYEEGDLIYIPAPCEHRIEARGDTDNEFFFVRLKS
jgi:quercetin dioxygenase-like cupin family protein